MTNGIFDITLACKTMESVARKAGNKLLEQQPIAKSLPTTKDFLSDCDLLSENIILSYLGEQFPHIPALSEEQGGTRTDGLQWVVDPIDGTINFVRQSMHWGVSIGLVEDDHAIAGVVYYPGYRVMLSAMRGNKLTLTIWNEFGASDVVSGYQCTTRDVTLAASQYTVQWGKEQHGGADHDRITRLVRELARYTLYPKLMNSATADIMLAVLGETSGHVALNADPYDIAAVGLIAEMAGLTVTDAQGGVWSPFIPSLVIAQPHLHSEFLQVVRTV
jgi:myo-inositol-1(or 4)-monophosphatase